MGRAKQYLKAGFKWVLKNWLLILIAYFAYMAMDNSYSASSYAARSMRHAEDAADYAAEAERHAENAEDYAAEAVDEIDRLKWRF